MPEAATTAKSYRLMLGVRAAGAIALLLLVYRVLADFEGTIRLLSQASPRWLAMGLVIAVVSEVVTATKWQLLARQVGGALPLAPAVRISLIGMFYNNLLPGSVGGDVARLLMAARYIGGRARAAASVFMQRNTGLGGLLLVGNIAAWVWQDRLASATSPWYTWPGLWFALVTAGYLAANAIILSAATYHIVWHWSGKLRTPHRFISAAAAKLKRLHGELLLYRGYWAVPLAISVATQLLDCTLVYVAARAIGLHPPYLLFLVSVPLVSVAALMPVTLNGIGLREIGYILLLSAGGISQEASAGIALLQFGYIAVLSLLGGLLLLSTSRPQAPAGSGAPGH